MVRYDESTSKRGFGLEGILYVGVSIEYLFTVIYFTGILMDRWESKSL